MSSSYLFYDLETSGLNKCFDQVLQFAAIRTDLELKELDRYEIFIKLNPDVIPSPAAVLVHQLSLEKMHQGIVEYEAIKEIHRLFNQPGTISIGYNNFGFDDEFLRFSFYRNLLAPYTHQYANNCGRMDIYPMTIMYYLFKPEAVIWPKIDGAITFKLEHLSRENSLTTGASHEAMNDVEATLRLARLLKKEQAMWEYLCGYFNKKTDLARLEKLTILDNKYPQGLLVDRSSGGAKVYHTPVIGLGLHYHYKNQSLWLSLEEPLATTSIVNRKRFGEPPMLLPFTERFSRYLTPERLNLVETNLEWVKKNPTLFWEIAEYHRGYKYPTIPDLDIDAALYQIGFISDEERFKCEKFHAASLAEKMALVEQGGASEYCESTDSYLSPNLRTQAIRVLGRNYPEILAQNEPLYSEYLGYLSKIRSGELMVDYKNKLRLTPPAALMEIEKLQESQSLSPAQANLLVELASYIQSW